MKNKLLPSSTATSDSKPGRLLVIIGPSAVGKDTVKEAFLAANPSFKYSISYTTRQPRAGEVDGVSYHFINTEKFKTLIEQDELIEWALVHGQYYGTSKRLINKALNNGEDLALILDVQGAKQLKNQLGKGVYVFLLPPSLEVLKTRLRERNSESVSTMETRIKNAQNEIAQAKDFDHQLINSNVEFVVKQLSQIMEQEALHNQKGLL